MFKPFEIGVQQLCNANFQQPVRIKAFTYDRSELSYVHTLDSLVRMRWCTLLMCSNITITRTMLCRPIRPTPAANCRKLTLRYVVIRSSSLLCRHR
eukprot:36037-Eustigmatos_ZCMA.PRE.1